MNVDVLDTQGKVVGSAELDETVWGIEPNIPVMHQALLRQLANARLGTRDTKTRGEVRGGGAKPWRQKGTGRARQGSRRAPQWTGGGVVHGPQPRDYAQRTPKKMIGAALRGALSDRAREGLVFVIDQVVEGQTPSTKQAALRLAGVGDYVRYLVVLHRDDTIGWMSLRNLPGVHVIAADQLNAYDVVVSDVVVFTQAALEVFVAGPTKGKSIKATASESEAAVAATEDQEDEK